MDPAGPGMATREWGRWVVFEWDSLRGGGVDEGRSRGDAGGTG